MAEVAVLLALFFVGRGISWSYMQKKNPISIFFSRDGSILVRKIPLCPVCFAPPSAQQIHPYRALVAPGAEGLWDCLLQMATG